MHGSGGLGRCKFVVCKVRIPILLGYAGFYTVYSWMILTVIL
jgi:hypothetical protein